MGLTKRNVKRLPLLCGLLMVSIDARRLQESLSFVSSPAAFSSSKDNPLSDEDHAMSSELQNTTAVPSPNGFQIVNSRYDTDMCALCRDKNQCSKAAGDGKPGTYCGEYPESANSTKLVSCCCLDDGYQACVPPPIPMCYCLQLPRTPVVSPTDHHEDDNNLSWILSLIGFVILLIFIFVWWWWRRQKLTLSMTEFYPTMKEF